MSKKTTGVALVTGASSGIGATAAERLVQAGYTVYGTSRRAAVPGQRSFEMLVLDVTSDGSAAAVVSEVIRRAGSIDLLVNNAGFGLAPAAAEESSIAQVQALFETNFYGVVRMTNAVLPIMRGQHYGRIVNVGSGLGLIPAPYSAYYSATKHALEGYSESLDHEVRDFGVRVTLVEPAATRTLFESSSVNPDKPNSVYDSNRAKYLQAFGRAMAIADTPESVADTIVKAASVRVPLLRYPSGKAARQVAFARRFLPRSLFDKVLRSQFGLA